MMNSFKIGVLFNCFNYEKYLDQSLQPWLNLKCKLNLFLAVGNHIGGNEIGGGRENDSITKLSVKNIDLLIHTSQYSQNDIKNSKNYLLSYLKEKECDLIWHVNANEIYAEDQIQNILNYIIDNFNYNSYELTFTNHIRNSSAFIGYSKSTVIHKNDSLHEPLKIETHEIPTNNFVIKKFTSDDHGVTYENIFKKRHIADMIFNKEKNTIEISKIYERGLFKFLFFDCQNSFVFSTQVDFEKDTTYNISPQKNLSDQKYIFLHILKDMELILEQRIDL